MFGKAVLAALAAAAVLFSASSAAADWLRAESSRFVVYSDGPEKSLREYVQLLESYDAFLRLQYGVPEDSRGRGKFAIYLVGGSGDLRRVRPGLENGVAGFYTAEVEDVFAVAMRDGDTLITLHEYAHHFMLSLFPYGYPAWLIEGWAEYYATFARHDADSFRVGYYDENRVAWLSNATWLPYKDVLDRAPGEYRSSSDKAIYYAQAWAFTHFMLGDPERAKGLTDYLKRVAAGEKSSAAMAAVLGVPVSGLERQVRRYLSRRFTYKIYTPPPRAAASISVTKLDGSAETLLLEAQQAKLALDPKQSAARAKRLRVLAARHPGDRLAELALARAEIHGGDSAAGESILRRRLEAHGDDVEVLQVLADSLLHRAEASQNPAEDKAFRDEARALLGRAHKLDDMNATTLAYFARARSTEPGYPSDNTLNVLLAAFDLAPNVSELRINVARALMRRSRYEEAIAVAEVLASSPHRGEDAALAAELIEEARTKLAAAPGASQPAATGAP